MATATATEMEMVMRTATETATGMVMAMAMETGMLMKAARGIDGVERAAVLVKKSASTARANRRAQPTGVETTKSVALLTSSASPAIV